MHYFSGVKKTYRYRLYPNKTQELLLHEGLNKLLPVVDGFKGRRDGGYEADEASMCTV